MIYTVPLADGDLSISAEAFEWLWPLREDFCPRNPLKGCWDQMSAEEYITRSRFFALKLIDTYGNLTDDGRAVVQAVFAAEDHDTQLLIDHYEMEELDDLDRKCRQRPHYDRYDG